MENAIRLASALILSHVVLLSFGIKAIMQEGQEIKSEVEPSAVQEALQNTRQDPSAEGKSEANEAGYNPAIGVQKKFVATVGQDGVQHVEIMGGEYYFDPNYIIVKINTPVEIKVKKAAGYAPHDIKVKAPEAGIDFETDLGKDWKSITFMPSKIGKYEMFCDERFLWFKSHKDRGTDWYLEVAP